MDSKSRFELSRLLSHLLVHARAVRDDCSSDLDPIYSDLVKLEERCKEIMSELGYLCLKKHVEPPTEEGEYLIIHPEDDIGPDIASPSGLLSHLKIDWYGPLPKGGA